MDLMEHLELSLKIAEAGGKFFNSANKCACGRNPRRQRPPGPQTFSLPLRDAKPTDPPVVACAACDCAALWPRLK